MKNNCGTMTEQNTMYFHPDHLGSSSYVTDKKGNFFEMIEYLPYGETLYDEAATVDKTEFRFTGHLKDDETGFYYCHARYYDSKIGKFLTPDDRIDGLFSSAGQNMYMYCHGNPIMYSDPDGHGKVGAVLGYLAFPLGGPVSAYVGHKIQDKFFGKKKGGENASSANVSSSSGSNETFANYKQQLVDNLSSPEGGSTHGRARNSFVEANGKRLDVNFTDTFCESMDGRKTPEEVIRAIDSKTFGVLAQSAFDSNVKGVMIEGLGRPAVQSYGQTHGQLKSDGTYTSVTYGIDVTGLTFNNGSSYGPMSTDSLVINFETTLMNNISAYGGSAQGMLLDPHKLSYYTNGQWSTDETLTSNIHYTRPHWHYSLMP